MEMTLTLPRPALNDISSYENGPPMPASMVFDDSMTKKYGRIGQDNVIAQSGRTVEDAVSNDEDRLPLPPAMAFDDSLLKQREIAKVSFRCIQ